MEDIILIVLVYILFMSVVSLISVLRDVIKGDSLQVSSEDSKCDGCSYYSKKFGNCTYYSCREVDNEGFYIDEPPCERG